MNSCYKWIKKYTLNIHILKLIVIAIGLSLINDFIFKLVLTSIANPSEINDLKDEGLGIFVFIIIIVGPFIETIIWQTLPINFVQYVLNRFTNKLALVPILISALLFGISHLYSFPYVILMSFRGMIYAWFFVIIQNRSENATLVVFVIHSLNNLILMISDIIL